jgi:DNA-directed RNA polymerase
MSETIEMPTDTGNKLMDHQKELELIFSKNQLMPRIRAEFQACEVDFPSWFAELGIPLAFGWDLLAQMAIHKRANLSTLVGTLYHHLDDAQATVDLLTVAAQADLIDWSPSLEMFVVIFTISDDVQHELDCFQYPLPMVVEPRMLETNKDTGYLFGSGSVILRNNHHMDDVCLDHLNRSNQVRLTINQEVVKMVRNSWKNLDRAKPGETKQEWDQRKKAFDKYDRTSKDVMDLLMRENDHFHLTHKYDKRGRVYACGYHVSTQGNTWNKACIEFAEKELIA